MSLNLIQPWETRVIRGERLRVGMTTVTEANGGKFKVDEVITGLVPHEGCLGLHFNTKRNAVVCYEPCAFVRVLI